MAEMVFWGEKGEYGPFPVQEDGWPHAGEVIRHYRRKRQRNAAWLAQHYGKAIGVEVTARWILKMEHQNKVPTDITRRRVLASILEVPPLLLGLASLEQLRHNPATEMKTQGSIAILRHTPSLDIAKYDQYARARWLLSYTGEESLKEIATNIQELEKLEGQSGGDLQEYVRKVLNSHYQLASDIARHQGNFSLAWFYANEAARMTKLIGMNDLLATALYRRGYTSLEWAIFGDNVLLLKINHEPDRKKIEAAIADFHAALPHARPQLKGAIWIELSRAYGIMKDVPMSLRLISQAESMVEAGSPVENQVDQILLEGALNGLNEGMYLLGKAASFIVIGRTTTALELLDDLEELRSEKGITSNQTRRLAYADMLRAEASLGTKDYMNASHRAISALKIFRDIHTSERIAWINDIYRKLLEKYGNRSEVKELGDILRTYKDKRRINPKK